MKLFYIGFGEMISILNAKWLVLVQYCISDVLIFQELWFRQITSAIGVGKVLYLIVGFKIAKQVVIVVLKARCVSYY